MFSHQVYNSNGGLAPKIGLVLGQKLDGYSYEQALSRYVQMYFPTCEDCVYIYVYQNLNTPVHIVSLGQSLMVISTTGVLLYAEVSLLYNVLWECIVVVYT